MSTQVVTATFDSAGDLELTKDILRKRSRQLLVQLPVNMTFVILLGHAIRSTTPPVSPCLWYLGLGFLALWLLTSLLDNLFLSIWAERKATLAVLAKLDTHERQISPSNSDTTLVEAQECDDPPCVGNHEEHQADRKESKGRGNNRDELFSSNLAGSANILPDGRLSVKDLTLMDPLERQRYIDATLADGVIAGLVYGRSGLGTAGASRNPLCMQDHSANLLSSAISAYTDIKVTEAVHALAYLADVDFEGWKEEGISCCCMVVEQDLHGYPSEGGDIVSYNVCKDVILVASSKGYSPKVQEVLHYLAAAAPREVAVVYQSSLDPRESSPDRQDIDGQTSPTSPVSLQGSNFHTARTSLTPFAPAGVATPLNIPEGSSEPTTYYHAGCRDTSLDHGFRFDLRIQISEMGRQTPTQGYRLKTAVEIFGREKVVVQSFEAKYSTSGRHANTRVGWDLDRHLFELSPSTSTTLTRGLSGSLSLGMNPTLNAEISVLCDAVDEKHLVFRPNPHTGQSWSKLEHADMLTCRSQEPLTYFAKVKASLKAKINPVMTSEFTVTLSLDFKIAPSVPLKDDTHAVIVSYEGNTIENTVQNPIIREGQMG